MSPVATQTPKANVTPRTWTRTPELDALFANHLAMVDREWSTADPELVALLKDPTVLDSEEVRQLLGYASKTRVFQLYSNTREWAEEDQLPHPSALPEADASFGRRGPREIRGVAAGRVIHWGIQTGRLIWDPFSKQLVLQTKIQFGGAPRQ